MPAPLTLRRRMGILLACTATMLILSATQAQAQEDPENPGPSAVDQYVEAVVTASAPSVPGATKETRTGLSAAAKRALKQASPSTASALEQVATSSTYGAPKNRPTALGAEPDIEPSSSSAASSLRTTVTAIGETTDTRLLGLLAVVLATTVGAAAIAVRRARSSLAAARSEETDRGK